MSGHNILNDLNNAPFEVADPGDGETIKLNVQCFAVIPLTIGAGAETGTLPPPDHLGQEVLFCVDEGGGGTRTITLTDGGHDPDAGGVASVALTTAGEFVLLRAIKVGGEYRWGKVTA